MPISVGKVKKIIKGRINLFCMPMQNHAADSSQVLFVSSAQQDTSDCKILYGPYECFLPHGRHHYCKTPAERMQSRVQQMNIINQRDKQGDKLKSS